MGFIMRISVRTLALAALAVTLLVVCSEVTLTLLRTRSIEVSFGVDAKTAGPATPEAAATPDPGKAEVLTIKPDGTITVEVKWNYRIGPRFPVTVVRAEAISPSDSNIASSKEFMIDCGTEVMQCQGDQQLQLNFGVKDNQGTP